METSRLSLTSVSVQSLSGCNAIKTQGQFSFFFLLVWEGGEWLLLSFPSNHTSSPPPPHSPPPPMAAGLRRLRSPGWIKPGCVFGSAQHNSSTGLAPRHSRVILDTIRTFGDVLWVVVFSLSASLKGKLSFQFISYLFVFCDVWIKAGGISDARSWRYSELENESGEI